jgi:uroporphyrinogen decarboxylase
LGIAEDYWRYDNDTGWRLRLNKAYNDRAEKIVGRRLLSEQPDDPSRRWPPNKELHDLFEARNVWRDRSWWLMASANNEDELAALLDRVEHRLTDVAGFILPANWESEKKRLRMLGVEPPLYRWQRGPVTFATSVFGIENFIFLINDNPELAVRFRDLILRAMLAIGRVLDEEAGYTQRTSPRGFGFADDNCAMLTADMYELFGHPVLKKVFETYSPGNGETRYQHSDSAMGHILPILGRLNLTGVNFGPTIRVSDIRRHLPHAIIDGQLAPFTYSRNEEENIVVEFLRDFEQARELRGLRFTTAGSINNGSRLTGMRLIMAAIQRHGRY